MRLVNRTKEYVKIPDLDLVIPPNQERSIDSAIAQASSYVALLRRRKMLDLVEELSPSDSPSDSPSVQGLQNPPPLESLLREIRDLKDSLNAVKDELTTLRVLKRPAKSTKEGS